MQRDPARLEADVDVLVAGGGIYGAAVAWDAAQRGLSVALVDRADFGSGTSFNNAKTVHGGVRSLQRGALGELRQYVRERRALSRIAPHLVQPLPFLVPTRGRLHRSRAALAVYFALYDLLSRDRNEGVPVSRQLPASRLLSRDACLAAHSALGADASVTGAAVWHDGQLLSGERMTLAFIKSAVGAGALAANYTELTGLEIRAGQIAGAHVRDTLSGCERLVRARTVVNATGPAAQDIVRMALGTSAPRLFDTLSLAMNVVVPGFDSRMAVGGMARGRLFFLAPWRGVTVGGTSHDALEEGRSEPAVTLRRVDALLHDLNLAFPAARLRVEDVRLVHRGLLPAHASTGDRVVLVKDSIVRDHAADGCRGLISVVGTRYTTARDTAETAADLLIERLGRSPVPCRTATTPLVGGEVGDPVELARNVPAQADPAAASDRVLSLYGTEWRAIDELVRTHPALALPLGPGCDTIGAEIVHAVRSEMAVHLTDALLRRSDAGSAGHPGARAVHQAALLMAAERDWDAAEQARQIAAVDEVYRIGE